MLFEDRLARVVSTVLGLSLLSAAGCGGGKDTDTDGDTATTTGAGSPTGSPTGTPTGTTTTTPAGTPTGTTTTTGTGTPTGTTTTPPTGIEALCDGAPPPTDYQVTAGWVTVAPGDPCPDATAVTSLEIYGCTWLEWQGVTCDYVELWEDQVYIDDGYGGYWADAGATPPGYTPGPVVDVCWYDGVWYLPPDHPTCGRPLLRDGEPVVAEVRPGDTGWAAAPHPVVAGLTDAEREDAEAYWAGAAALEHASVASFSHAALGLMRFGAPPELLAATHQAALDEITHARLCFALASGYAGQPVGPGPLVAPPPSTGGLADFAEALFREGCVGETLAAVDAAARLAVARDPAVREALGIILRDESAHAALAWRTLRWVLEQDRDGAVRQRVAAAFAEEEARWTAPVADDMVSAEAQAHGLIGKAERARELRRAWREVVAPSWAALA